MLSRAMRDNPLHIAAFGDDPERRVSSLEALFRGLLPQLQARPLAARRGGFTVAVFGIEPPGACEITPAHILRMAPRLLRVGPSAWGRLAEWQAAWAAHDPDAPHWHLGPFGVEPALQGMGVGSQLLERVCGRLDRDHADGYLETDREENVRLYQRFGFEVTGEVRVLGVRCWYMARRPRA